MMIQDFVNREYQLDVIWNSIVGDDALQLILISGTSGIGKSYLLQECQERCRRASIPNFSLDFEHPRLQDYLEVIQVARRQLGYDKFAALTQTLADVRLLSEQSPPRQMPLPTTGGGKNIAAIEQVSRIGGIDFKDVTATARDIVGHDINYVIQILQKDDPFVQVEICERITASWQACLKELTTTQTIVCFMDSWEKATSNVNDWVNEAILNAMLNGQLGNFVIVLAGQSVPELRRIPGRIYQITLDALSEDAVHKYWVERRGLGDHEWEHVFRLTFGYPYMVAAIADLHSLSSQARLKV